MVYSTIRLTPIQPTRIYASSEERRGHLRVVIAEMDEETSERYAAIVQSLRLKGTPIPTNDLWIAASAMQHGLRVLTTDKHYLEIPQIIAEYFGTEKFWRDSH